MGKKHASQYANFGSLRKTPFGGFPYTTRQNWTLTEGQGVHAGYFPQGLSGFSL